MKKTIFLLFLLVGFGFSASAQISGGIKGGLNFAKLDYDLDGVDPKSKTGFHVGVFADISLAGIGIMPEAYISFQGSEFDGGGELDLTYIQVPILLKKSFAKVLNIHLGPQFGILTTAEDEDGEDVKEFLKGSDLSLAVGAGLDLPIGLSAGLRYVYGLSDINDSPADVKIQGRTIQLYASYKLFGN